MRDRLALLFGRRRVALTAALGVATCFWLSLPIPAHAVRGLTTGIGDGPFEAADPSEANAALDRVIQARAGIVRIKVDWSRVASNPPADPANPADAAYDFTAFDRAIKRVQARGLQALLLTYHAPTWAEGPNRASGAATGTWRPQAAAFGAFGRALAARYSGSFPDPAGGGALPRVRYFQAWNEPNLPQYITPQWDGSTPASPGIYRDLLNSFYAGVKSVRPDDLVVSAGTAPYGDGPGGSRVRPLAFWRTLLCVQGGKKLRGAPCPGPVSLDVFAHHPINTTGGPRRSAIDPDDVSSPDLGALTRVFRAAERFHTVVPAGRHPLWATEFWWNTNPPNTARGVAPQLQARWIEEALYLFWKQGVQLAINLQIDDAPFNPADPLSSQQAGLFTAGGAPKPSLTAFAFPFVTERTSKTSVIAWGKAPVAGKLTIRRVGKSSRPLKKLHVSAGGVFRTKLALKGRSRLRAAMGGQQSLIWAQK